MRVRYQWFFLLLLLFGASGCAGFAARRIAQAPNTYPEWLAPEAPVVLEFSSKLLTNSPKQYLEVGPPAARLCYRIVEPADYKFKWSRSNSHNAKAQVEFSFEAKLPPQSNQWSSAPRGTVFLLHGYGVAQFSMLPWALQLSQEGWRCVLLDLRGHGKSTGDRIYFGTRETKDLTQLVDHLASRGQLVEPVAAIGDSYGAALVLRWKTVEPRVGPVVAISPYPNLARATLNISNEYAAWVPDAWLKAGLKKLPDLLGIDAAELNPEEVLKKTPVKALFVAGSKDKIAPEEDVAELWRVAAPESKFIVVPGAAHEPLPYYFDDLLEPVSAWLAQESPVVARRAEGALTNGGQ